MRRKLAAWGSFILIVLSITACTGNTTVNAISNGEGISVSGTGRVVVEPDIGVINLGVEVTKDTVGRARTVAAEAMEKVRLSLADNNVQERDIKTRFFSIYPKYDYENRNRDGQPKLSGFTVSNQIEVKIRDIDRLSKILDMAISAGGNAIRVDGISFEVDEPGQFHKEARRLAVEDARAKAQQLADLAGVSLGKARAITESSGGVAPKFFAEARAMSAPSVGTSISPGESEIVLNVSVVYEAE